MVVGSDLDGARLKRRIVAGKRLKHLHLEYCDFAEVGLRRICAGAQEIPITFDAATRRALLALMISLMLGLNSSKSKSG